MSNKSAAIRTALAGRPAGMDYDQLSQATGIGRDRITSFLSVMLGNGDVKAFLEDGKRIFKYSGDPDRAGPRVADSTAPAPLQRTPMPPARTVRGSASLDDSGHERPPAVSLGAQKPAPPSASAQSPPLREGAESAAAAGPRVQSEDVPSYLPGPPRRIDTNGAELEALTLDNVLAAAAHLAAVVRDQVDEWEGCEGIAHAVKGYELAERIYGASRVKA